MLEIHGRDLSKAEVLDSNPYTAPWCILESWHIQQSDNKLNRELGNLPEDTLELKHTIVRY